MARPDFSDYVAHFTKNTSPCSGNQAYIPTAASDRLIQILSQRTIKASIMPWTNKHAVCFTECPFYSMFDHKQQYSAYGIGFKKETVFRAGGGPAIYLRQNLHDVQLNNFSMNTNDAIRGFHKDIYAFMTPFKPSYGSHTPPCDYSHEREWRTTADFSFTLESIEFITVQSHGDVNRIMEQLAELSENKFLIFDVIEKIETLWPTHRL